MTLLNHEDTTTQYANHHLSFVNDVSIAQQVGKDLTVVAGTLLEDDIPNGVNWRTVNPFRLCPLPGIRMRLAMVMPLMAGCAVAGPKLFVAGIS